MQLLTLKIVIVWVTYELDLQKSGFSSELIKKIQDYWTIYAIIYKGADGKYKYGLDERADEGIGELVQKDLQDLKQTGISSALLFIRVPTESSGRNLPETVKNSLTLNPIGGSLDRVKLPEDVALYVLAPPSKSAFLPLYILAREESWFIPDIKAERFLLQWTWRYRIASNPTARLRLLNDYRAAEYIAFAPVFNPDLDSAPALGAFGKPFGEVKQISVLFGGDEQRSCDVQTSCSCIVVGPKNMDKSGRPASYILALERPQ